jgi:hypothetical protein
MSEHIPTNTVQRRTKSCLSALLRNTKVIRWLLATLIGFITVIVIATRGYPLLTIHIDGMPDLPYNDLVGNLIEIKREQSGKVFDVALLVSGALFALLIAKKNEARIVLADYPEVIMLSAASVLLLASLACNLTYLELMSESLYLGGHLNLDVKSMPNIFESAFEQFYTAQIIFLCGGGFAAAITLISAHRLKEDIQHA